MEIGTLLRKLRDKKHLSTRAVAEKTGVGLSTYLSWEHDKSSPSLINYIKLAEAFDIGPVEFMSFLTGKTVNVTSARETEIEELKETVHNLRRYTVLLGDEKEIIKDELKKMMELIKQIQNSPQKAF